MNIIRYTFLFMYGSKSLIVALIKTFTVLLNLLSINAFYLETFYG